MWTYSIVQNIRRTLYSETRRSWKEYGEQNKIIKKYLGKESQTPKHMLGHMLRCSRDFENVMEEEMKGRRKGDN